jgi:aldehyde dehydrogenase (NAD+)
LSNRQKFYINGEWVQPTTTEMLDVINPATEQPIEAVAMGGAEDVNKAVAAAKEAFETFSQTTKEERIALLEAVIAKYAERMGDIAAVISEEMGAPAGLAAKAQAPTGIGHLMTAVNVLKDFEFEEDMGTTRVIREPAGVCGFITPWNWPINQIACKVAPALAAGCTYGAQALRSGPV